MPPSTPSTHTNLRSLRFLALGCAGVLLAAACAAGTVAAPTPLPSATPSPDPAQSATLPRTVPGPTGVPVGPEGSDGSPRSDPGPSGGGTSPGYPGGGPIVVGPPVTGTPDGGDPGTTMDGTLVKPDPKVIDLHKQAWDHVVVRGDGKTLDVYFWGGVQDCYGLGRVEVSKKAGQLTIQLWTGTQPSAVGRACIDIAQLFKTTVVNDAPLIRGGAG
jgi:hypothetical protein